MGDIEILMNGLNGKDEKYAYECLKELEELSENSGEVYKYFDIFSDMLDDEKTYVRGRGIILISANAKWDKDNKIDEIIDKYLKHILDVKPTISRRCVKVLPNIAKYKPDLKSDIIFALKNADISIYAESMSSILEKDIKAALAEINAEKI